MPQRSSDLGKVISVHGISPAQFQRAAVVVVLSFVFFLAMLLAFYIRQQILYFVLSSAFLVVYLFTMIGWWMQKRGTVTVYENGISYKKFTAAWDEITRVESNPRTGITITASRRRSVTLPASLTDFPALARTIRSNLPPTPQSKS